MTKIHTKIVLKEKTINPLMDDLKKKFPKSQ